MDTIDFSSSIWQSGLRAAGRGVLGVQFDPQSGEERITLNREKTSPSLDRFSCEAGGAENALVILAKSGAPCYASDLDYARQHADPEAREFAERCCEARQVGSYRRSW